MRKIFTLFTMCLMAMAVWAQTEIVFEPKNPAGSESTVSTSDEMSQDGIIVSSTYAAFNANQYRFGKGAVTTFKSTIGNITKIQFFCTTDNPAKGFGANDGMTYEDPNGTWEGNPSPEVVLTTKDKQVRATKIVFTVDASGLASPSIKPAAGTYYGPVEVTITCGTPNSKIYYTTNGNDPTTSSTQYSAPFTLNSSATVKAISAKDGETSDVVSAEYEIKQAIPVYNIAEFQGQPDDAVLVFKNPVTVLAHHAPRMFVMDNTGYALFYGDCGRTYKNGDVIPADFVGTKTTWDGEPELKDLQNFAAPSSNSPVTPEDIDCADVVASFFGHYVQIMHTTVIPNEAGNGGTIIDEDGNEAPFFLNMGATMPTDLEAKYTVIAIVGSHGKAPNTVYQLLPIRFIKEGGPIVPEGGLGGLINVPDGTDVTLEYEATVLKQSGQRLYLMDATGFGLVYGSTGKTYSYGDVIPAGYGGSKTTWDGEPEVQSPKGFQDPIGNIGGLDALKKDARITTCSEVAHPIWGQFVLLKQVTVDPVNGTLTDASGSCSLYDMFGVAAPGDLSKPYDVYGIVASHGKAPNTVYQILPIEYVGGVPAPPTPVANLQELYDLTPEVQKGIFTTPITVVYHNPAKLDMYIVDADGEFGLVYGRLTNTFVNGDIINDAVATWKVYNNVNEVIPVDETFVKAGHGAEIEPEMLAIEEISNDMVHNYLRFENVTIEMREENGKTNYYLIDENGDGILIFDRYELGLKDLDFSKHYDVDAFLTIFSKDKLKELYPILIVEHGVPPVNPFDVNHDGEVNIADINALIDMILSGNNFHDCNGDGEMNIADVNALIDYILGA